MISINDIKQSFSGRIQDQSIFYEYMVKEYFQYKILDFIFNSRWASKLSFIGGTNIRIIHKIERFSEDLDFDTFNLSHQEFLELTDDVIKRLQNEGIEVFADDKAKDAKLTAFRRNITFPQLLFQMGLSGHKEKRFLIKIESEPHQFSYIPDKPIIQKFNVLTQINVAPGPILLSMKIGAVLERKKGRDYYDCMFLMGKTEPDWDYLAVKFGITSPGNLKESLLKSCEKVDFHAKSEEFRKLIFDQNESKKVLLFREYMMQKEFSEFE